MRRISRTVVVLCAAAGLAGCGGPKRLPPVVTEPEPRPVPVAPVAPVVPRLLGVGLLEDSPQIAVAATGPAQVTDAADGRVLVRLAAAAEPLVVLRRGDGVAWAAAGAEGLAPAVRLVPADPSHLVTAGEEAYRGEFLVIPTPGRSTGLTLVNNIELEAYLQGVVPWEIGRHGRDALAALEAQAVAARTYTVSHLGARRDRGFDVFADVMDQVYRGARDEDPLCNEAIAATAGLVLRRDGAEIEAYYSACCGGVTSQVEEVWARKASPYLVSHKDGPPDGDPWCAGYRYFHWRETWAAAQLESILARTLPAYIEYATTNGREAWAGVPFTPRDGAADWRRPGGLLGLEILRRTTSGRVAELAVITDAGTYHVRGDRTRWVLVPASGRPAILRSALFDLELERTEGALRTVSARGRGYGHGIGLCQTGALAMARHGHSVDRILAHYYPGAVLVTAGGADR
ncbi:MAG: SpoIID/LytB domain-containing protein [Candidatus Krumholzibacteriia bacterium]